MDKKSKGEKKKKSKKQLLTDLNTLVLYAIEQIVEVKLKIFNLETKLQGQNDEMRQKVSELTQAPSDSPTNFKERVESSECKVNYSVLFAE